MNKHKIENKTKHTLAIIAVMAGSVISSQAFAGDLVTDSSEPWVTFDDSELAGNDWRIAGNGESDGSGFFQLRDHLDANSNNVITIQGTGGSSNNSDSLNINSSGDINLANGSVFINRSNNKVGIGTTTPQSNIDIKAAAFPDIGFQYGTGIRFEIEAGTNSLGINKNNGASIFNVYDGASPGSLIIGDINGGTSNIGMGTSTPQSQLEVKDNERIEIRMNNTAAENWRITSRGTGLEYGIVESFGSEFANGKKMTLSGNGDLEVTGSYSVNAMTLDVPDYVFDADYKLMPLEKLESFIKSKKHLPNISSAKEINTSGKLDMTEMQLKLLEKIEELTLYTLKQESKIKVLQTENIASKTQLSAKNDQLQKRLASLEKLVTNLASGQSLLPENGNKVVLK